MKELGQLVGAKCKPFLNVMFLGFEYMGGQIKYFHCIWGGTTKYLVLFAFPTSTPSSLSFLFFHFPFSKLGLALKKRHFWGPMGEPRGQNCLNW